MHPNRIVTLFYCISGIAAAFLTWAAQSLLGSVTYLKGIDPGYSVTKTNIGDGYLTLACFCIIMAITAAGSRLQPMSRRKIFWIMLFAFVSLAISVYHIAIIFSMPNAASADDLQMKVAPGVGLYLTILVSLMLVLLPLRHRVILAGGSKTGK